MFVFGDLRMQRQKWSVYGSVFLFVLCGFFFSSTAWARGMQWKNGEDGAPLWIGERDALRTAFIQRQSPVLSGASFVRLGMRWDGPSSIVFQARFSADGVHWTTWLPMLRTWEEGTVHNSHADPPSGRSRYAQLRIIGRGFPTFLAAELIPRLGPYAYISRPQVRVVRPQEGRSSSQSSALSGPFNPRSAWGAKAAKCSSKDAKKVRIAIHHTDTPNNDTVPVETRLRGIQSFHQKTRGWCDIGYHLLISADGRAWEGRPAETLGAHVGSNNPGSLGLSFIGKFSTFSPPQKMLCTAAKLLAWANKTFQIKLNRTSVKGHREFPKNSTSCPGDKLFAQLVQIVQWGNAGGCGTSTACDYIKTDKLNGKVLNIRGGASSTFKILGTVPEGICLKVLSKKTGQSVSGNAIWYEIQHNGVKGWISGYFTVCSTCGQPPKDTEKPVITIRSPQDGAIVQTDSVEIKGHVRDNDVVARVTIRGKDVSLNNQNGFSVPIALQVGTQSIPIFAWDKSGNKAEKVLSITRKVQPEFSMEPSKEPNPIEYSEEKSIEPTPEPTQVDAGQARETHRNEPVLSDKKVHSDSRIVLDKPCAKDSDCPKGYLCSERVCKVITGGKPGGGCGCSSHDPTDLGWLGMWLVLFLVWVRRKTMQYA